MSSTTGVATETPYWDHTSTNGWLYLLPPLATRSVLFLSTQSTLSASQARLCLDPTLVYDDQIADLQRPSTKGEVGLRWCSVDELLTGTTPRFDGVIIHDPAGKLLHRIHWPRVMQLLRHLRVVLRPSGFVYIGMRHAHSMQQLAGRPLGGQLASTPRLLSVSGVRNDLRLAGYSSVAVHPYLMWGDKMAEVVSSQGYRSTKNRESLRERLKEFILGRLGARFFAPSYGLVAHVGEPAQSTIDILLGHVMAHSKPPGGAPLVVKQHLVFPGDKAIESVGAEHRSGDDTEPETKPEPKKPKPDTKLQITPTRLIPWWSIPADLSNRRNKNRSMLFSKRHAGNRKARRLVLSLPDVSSNDTAMI